MHDRILEWRASTYLFIGAIVCGSLFFIWGWDRPVFGPILHKFSIWYFVIIAFGVVIRVITYLPLRKEIRAMNNIDSILRDAKNAGKSVDTIQQQEAAPGEIVYSVTYTDGNDQSYKKSI